VQVVEGCEQGIYSREFTAQAYHAMLQRAASILASGRPVVLDASFRSAEYRTMARTLARKSAAHFLLAECRCPRELLLKRLHGRAVPGMSAVSEGRSELLDSFATGYEPPDEVPQDQILLLDTTRPPAQLAAEAIGRLKKMGLQDGITGR